MVTLTERGQGCLIPAPYFPGFDEALVSAGVRAWAARDASVGGAMMEAGADAGISPRVLEASFRYATRLNRNVLFFFEALVYFVSTHGEYMFCFCKKNLNASRPSEHPSVRGKICQNVYRWGHRLQIQNLMAFKRVPRW